MAAADADGNGLIDYDEFIASTVNLNKLEREQASSSSCSFLPLLYGHLRHIGQVFAGSFSGMECQALMLHTSLACPLSKSLSACQRKHTLIPSCEVHLMR